MIYLIRFKAEGSKDYMGFTWFGVYNNGEPVYKRGVHIRYNAKDAISAEKMWDKDIELFGYPK
jgi:hypothetical protein